MRWTVLITGMTLLFACLGIATPARADQYSLLIGINDYLPQGPDDGDLEGCKTDVQTMRRILSMRQFPTDANHQKILLDAQATGQAIFQALLWLQNSARKREDTVVIYYSGHGDWLPVEKLKRGEKRESDEKNSGDRKDGFDEAIVPTDADKNGLIVDDDIGIALSGIAAENVTVIFDSCFSGTATKLIGDPKADDPYLFVGVRNRHRKIHRAKMKRYRPLPAFSKGKFRAERRSTGQGPNSYSAADQSSDQLVYLSACQPWELSSDDGPEVAWKVAGARSGMFTSHLYYVIRDFGIDTSWRNLMREVRRRIALEEPLQEPYAEGPIDRAPFTTRTGGHGKLAPRGIPVPLPLKVSLHTAIVTDGPLDRNSNNARKFRTEVETTLLDQADGLDVKLVPDGGQDVAILKKPDGYRVWAPTLDGDAFLDVGDFETAIRHLAGGLRFVRRLQQLAAFNNPAAAIRVRLEIAGGPSAQVKEGGTVQGSFQVAQPCRAQLYRADVYGTLTLLGDVRECQPGQKYDFEYVAGKEQGKELVKVVITTQHVDLSKIVTEADPLHYLSEQLGAAKDQWSEDQESLYVGDWLRLYAD